MALNMNKKPKSFYYSIGEVAKMFDINESTLRYWESEFPHLNPRQTARTLDNIQRKISNKLK